MDIKKRIFELTEIEALEPQVLHEGLPRGGSVRHFMYIEAH